MQNKRGQVFRTKHALPFLENGAMFVFEPQYAQRGKKVRTYKIRLRFPCGEYVEGSWGNAKNELWRMARLEQMTFDGDTAWRLKTLKSE